MSQTKELEKILIETKAILQDISVVEEKKFQAAIKNHILEIEDCIKKEQALLLRFKGVEHKRLLLQKEMQAEDMTLKQIIETVSPEERDGLQAAFYELEHALKVYEEIYGRAKTAIEVNLHRINTEMEALAGSPLNESVTYSVQGEKKQTPKAFTNKTI
nr:flagellar export chaperone FlgN [uncultured Anaerotignum sp.]